MFEKLLKQMEFFNIQWSNEKKNVKNALVCCSVSYFFYIYIHFYVHK